MIEQNDTPSVDFQQHLELAAFHLFELCRSWSKVILPSFADDDVQDMRRDAKYRAMSAHRRGIKSCRAMTIDRVAGCLAVADALQWPSCTRPGWTPDPVQDAQRRQRYRHVAGVIMAEAFMYLEHDTDTEEQRTAILADINTQRVEDKRIVSEWRRRIGQPSSNGHGSTVTQIQKDSER